MASYEHTTRAQLKTKIQEKLGEEGVFWLDSELNQNIEEALLTFGAVSGFWKENIQILTEENKRIYDFFADTTVGDAFIEPSLTYQKLVDWLNKDLLENLSIATPTSEFLTLDTFIKAIDAKYNLYQQLTNLVVSKIELPVHAQNNIIVLPDYFIDMIRVIFREGVLDVTILDQVDEAELQYFSEENISGEGTPIFYANVYGKTKELALYPIPSINGTLQILCITGRDLSVASDLTTEINLPNNLVPYLKYGILADIYAKDGVLNDVARAAYCKQRWEEGLIVGRNYTSAFLAKANNKIITIDSLNNIDFWFDGDKVRFPPRVCGFAGFNIFLIDITPSADLSSMEFTINANAKLPVNDADFIRIDEEYIDMFAGYVVHLCMQKSGIAEIAATDNLKETFLKTCLQHNQRLQFKGITYETLMGITKKQEKEQNRIPKEQVNG